MMASIAQDFVKYVMHVQVVVEEQRPANEVVDMAMSGPEDPSSAGSTVPGAVRAQAAAEGLAAPPEVDRDVVNTPVVKSEWDKTPRNAPCPCGSGKKFKQCHGA
jgi:preprotein translocase subunit SecA